jgi:hypothetical protein
MGCLHGPCRRIDSLTAATPVRSGPRRRRGVVTRPGSAAGPETLRQLLASTCPHAGQEASSMTRGHRSAWRGPGGSDAFPTASTEYAQWSRSHRPSVSGWHCPHRPVVRSTSSSSACISRTRSAAHPDRAGADNLIDVGAHVPPSTLGKASRPSHASLRLPERGQGGPAAAWLSDSSTRVTDIIRMEFQGQCRVFAG